MCKQSAVMAIVHSKFFRLVVYLFDGVLRLWLFSHLVYFRSGFTCGSLDIIRVLFPPVCDLFSPYSVRAFLVVFLTLVYFTHRPFTPLARNNAIWSTPRCFVFLFDQYCTFFAIPSCFKHFSKKTAAALTVLFFQCDHSLSVWFPDCDAQSTD